MRHSNPVYNIMNLLQSLGELEGTQLVTFLTESIPPAETKHILSQLTLHNHIKYDPNTGIYKYRGAPDLSKEFSERQRLAFWCVAYTGVKRINEVIPIYYPSSLLYIDTDDNAYDVTVVASESQAQLAARIHAESTPRNRDDSTSHIALLLRESDKKYLKNCNFDFYCTLDKNTHKPSYVEIEE